MAALAMTLLGGGLQPITGTIGNVFQGIGSALGGQPMPSNVPPLVQSQSSSSGKTMLYVIGGVSVVAVLGALIVMKKKGNNIQYERFDPRMMRF